MVSNRNRPEAMTRREVLKYGLYGGLAASTAGGLWLAGCERGEQEEQAPRRRWDKKPNVVFVVIDTLRADHCGCYGYGRDTTPAIDRLSKESLRFQTAISAAPWTTPSVASMLTGQYPTVLGLGKTTPMGTIDSRLPILAQLLRQAGYRTHGIVSHALLGPQIGFARGFDQYEWSAGSMSNRRSTCPEVTAAATRALKTKQDKPLFLFLHYFDPHPDFIFHEKHDFYSADHGAYSGPLRSNHPLKDLWLIRDKLSAKDLEYLVSLYDSEIAYTDRHLAQVLDTLKGQGLYDDTVIVVTADHGEEFMERGWIGHVTTLYQELLHVPLVMKLPGIAPRTIDVPVGLIDVMPTLLRFLDVEIPKSVDGKPWDLRAGGRITRSPIFSETFSDVRKKFAKDNNLPPKDMIALKAIILGDRKLIYDENTEARQVFDLAGDPQEQTDLWPQRKSEDRRMGLLLAKWMEYVSKKKQDGPEVGEDELFTPEQIEELKSMGYL